jgi:hypothetical protein
MSVQNITDLSGNQIMFTGKENYNEYSKKLIHAMRTDNCYYILEDDYLDARPLKPTTLLEKRARQEMTSANEDKKIAEWTTYLTQSKSASTRALNIIKKALAREINIWIEGNIENRGENPTPENVKAILKEIERNFGTYSHPKDTRSRKDLDAIPKFTNSQSVLDGIDKIKLLNEERTQ